MCSSADCSCWAGLRDILLRPRRRSPSDARDEFERTVTFLASVPLFRNRLPRSELPKVAESLSHSTWKPGQRLVNQGETGRAFFLIQSGEAFVVTAESGEDERAVATLRAGDYFGCHTLTREQKNVATIIAKGPKELVTLSMSRAAFEDAGLMKKLHLTKRPAYLADRRETRTLSLGYCCNSRPLPSLPQVCEKTPEEEAFIKAALGRNCNLRALLEASDGMLSGVSHSAERREVRKGQVVAHMGEMGQELFIVRSGCFDAVFEDLESSHQGQQSAECAVQRSTMAERLLRKENFMRCLATLPPLSSAEGRRANSIIGGQRPVSKSTNQSARVERSGGKGTFTRRLKTVDPAEARRPSDSHPCVPLAPAPLPSSGGRRRSQPRQKVPTARNDSEPDKEEWKRPRASSVTMAEVDAAAPSGGPTVRFGEGESFGELSLLYNTRREVTFRACEDSVVYVVGRRHFTAAVRQEGRRIQEYVQLLKEVHTLTSLLSTERWELACNAAGLVQFQPGERVIHQGKERQANQWYVVHSGSGVMVHEQDGQECILAELHRGHHFGERSLLRGAFPQVSVDAGPDGMVCLTFDGSIVKVLLEDLFQDRDTCVPSVSVDIGEWCASKARGWESHDTPEGSHVAFHDLRQLSVLGSGSYGQVLLTESTVTKKRYALKVVSKGHVVNDRSQQQICWERELLLMLDSPFVVCLQRTFRDAQCLYFLFEAALGGSLLEVLHGQHHVFVEDNPRGSSAAFYSACLTLAIEHLHERHIVHRDVKPENTLLDERGYAKLCDMGFARFVLGKTNTFSGTPDYMAPEVIDFPHTHGMEVDWWSLGCLTYELLAGQPPWEDEGIFDPMGRILAIRRSQEQGRIEFPFHFPHVARSYITELLQKDPTKRLGAKGAACVKDHAMYRSLHFDFEKLHARELPSPYVPPKSGVDADLADSEEGLQLDPSLFATYQDDGTGWDSNF